MEFLSDHEEKLRRERRRERRGEWEGEGSRAAHREGSGRAGFKEEEPSVSPVRPE